MHLKLRLNSYAGSALAATLTLSVALVWAATPGPAAQDAARQELETQFASTVKPFLLAYCTSCHGKDKPVAQLDLSLYGNLKSVTQDYAHWSLMLDRIAAKEMPPAGSKMPTAAQRDAVIRWIRAVRRYEASRNAGDPGPVLARRLSNAEYDNTIRDLTGVELRPTKEFPVDPANQEGFDNSGESLTLSPALIKKYVAAARAVAENMALTTTGLDFAAHPVLAETDRDKFCILRIVDFYKQQPTDFADYFYAAWRYKNRSALGIPGATLPQVAREVRVSPRYLDLVYRTLTDKSDNAGPLAPLREKWNALPARPDDAREGCTALRDWVQGVRKKVAWRFGNLRVPHEFSAGGQCNILWKDRQYASHRRSFDPTRLQIGGVPATKTTPARRRGGQEQPEQTVVEPVDPDLFVPEGQPERAVSLSAFERFASVFPDAFFIAERGLMEFDDIYSKGRLLTAGSHNAMGYFRDDASLMELILDAQGCRTLDTLWLDFNTVASVPERMHLEFFFYERAESRTILDPEFQFARGEDRGNLAPEKIKLFADLYYAKAKRNGGDETYLGIVQDHFKRVATDISATRRARVAAEPVHLRALLDFAARAYRRPLAEPEKAELLGFYKTLREKEGLTHEDALRDSVTRILLSPNFLLRMDLEAPTSPAPPPGSATQPLDDYALASRLSYFLWSSMPDDTLLSLAAKKQLRKPDVLLAQTHRMLKSPKVRALATEFGGNWLDFRRFEEHNAVDRERFPTFDDNLRESMFQEPVRFLTDAFQNDRSVLDLLYGKYTFVNADLAKHYDMADVKIPEGEWVRVENAERYGRGGILPMALFLTKNASSLRTSPVRRGYWVVKRVLGEYIPPPPAVVPELPKDEKAMGDQTLRQALAKHRQNPACASCHARFDSYGLVFEGFGPIGRRREKDMGGKPIDASAPFPGGPDRTGLDGLRSYVKEKRQKDFLDNVSRKLLSYALGRTLQPSDDVMLATLHKNLAANDYKLGTLIDTIVTSKLFLNRRTSISEKQ
jgi:mono/diheme cytochrome c family protein